MGSGSLSDWAADTYMGGMTGDQIANIAFLALLGAALGGSYLVSQRGNMGRVAQQASIWALIFVGVVAAFGMWGDIQRSVRPMQSVTAGGEIVVPRSPDGHYYLVAEINGTPVNFVVDTGASDMVLTQGDAARAGIDPSTLRYVGQAMTANGMVSTAAVTLDSVMLGGVIDEGVRAVVNGGEMGGSLLGMRYLDRFSSIQIRDGELVLTR